MLLFLIIIAYSANLQHKKEPNPKTVITFSTWGSETEIPIIFNAIKQFETEIFGTGFEANPLFWLPFLWSNGGGILSNDAKNIIIGSKNSIWSIQQYSDLPNKYKIAPSSVDKGSMTMGQMFINQKIAMQINGRWAVTRFRKDLKFQWDNCTISFRDKGVYC